MLKEGPEEPTKKTHRNASYLLEINLQAYYFISNFFCFLQGTISRWIFAPAHYLVNWIPGFQGRQKDQRSETWPSILRTHQKLEKQ